MAQKSIKKYGFVSAEFVNWPTSSGPNPVQIRKYKPEPGPNPRTNLKLKPCPKKHEVKLGLKNLATLPSYFEYVFVHLRQKACLRSELSPKFCQLLLEHGPNPTRKPRPDLQLCVSNN